MSGASPYKGMWSNLLWQWACAVVIKKLWVVDLTGDPERSERWQRTKHLYRITL